MRGKQIKLGAAIKAARKRLGLTQAELADRLDISVRYLQTIENEKQTPSYKMLEQILNCLEIPANSIFEYTEDEITPEKQRLLYLISNKCDSSDIPVLLATAEALINRKEIWNSIY